MRHQEGGSEGKRPASSRTWPTGLEVRDTAVQRTLTGEAGRAGPLKRRSHQRLQSDPDSVLGRAQDVRSGQRNRDSFVTVQLRTCAGLD